MPFKDFAGGQEALAEDIDLYLMGQTVMRFPTAAARTSALPTPVKGQCTARDDRPSVIEMWDGGAWTVASSVEYLFSKTITGTVPVPVGYVTTTLALPAAWYAGAVILDAGIKIDSGAGTYGQALQVGIDVSSSPAATAGTAGYCNMTTAFTSMQPRVLGAWNVTRGQVVTAVIRVSQTGGQAMTVALSRLEGSVRMVPWPVLTF
jgi:hypothetical protein